MRPALIGVVAGLACAGALAQHDGIGAALKDLQPAGGACRRDDGSRAKGITRAAAPPPDLSCAVGGAALAAWQGAARPLVIDVRPLAEYRAGHIDGALSMSVADVRTKPFLRGRAIVLAGSGKAQRELFEACSALKAQGFRLARVLQGGMAAWTGTAVRLSAIELWAEYQFDFNIVLVPQAQRALLDALPLAFPVPQASAVAIRKAIERRRVELKNAPLAGVVVVLPADASDAQVDELRRAVLPAPLLVYAGSAEAFAREMQVHKAVWAAHARGPKQPPCGS